MSNQLAGKWPAIVREWIRERRECRVEIPSLTDGAEVYPLAQIEYPIGDKSEDTEIYVRVGDRVWVEFERGDARYPIITGFRSKQVGNRQLWRKFEHENHERDALDGDIYDHASNDIINEAGNNHSISAIESILTSAKNENKSVLEVYTLEAGTSIELKVGQSSILITSGSITVTTPAFIGKRP